VSAPLIFIQYNDSYYLKYSLESAVLFNPDKKVILLGDANNVKYKDLGVIYYSFADFCEGPEISEFDQNYCLIAGKEHYRREWTKFTFRRWFMIYNFLAAHDISSFWTFDSDNLILTRLSTHEIKFRNFACTEQCSGSCINGFVSNREVVKGYLDKINELFKRTQFLDEQRAMLKHATRYAFTEMNAYSVYKEEVPIRSIRLNTIIDRETFLDSICTLKEHRVYFNDDEYEIYGQKLWNNDLKKIYLGSNGDIYLRHRATQEMVKLNTINMSWTPGWLFDVLLKHSKRKLNGSACDGGSKPVIKPLNLRKHKLMQAGKKVLEHFYIKK
jgi:hypothetical protein